MYVCVSACVCIRVCMHDWVGVYSVHYDREYAGVCTYSIHITSRHV